MRNWKAVIFGLAATAAFPAAAAADIAGRTGQTIVPVSQVVDSIEARPDFGELSAVHYDTANHTYQVLYTATDGSAKVVVVDADNGRAIGDADVREASAASAAAVRYGS